MIVTGAGAKAFVAVADIGELAVIALRGVAGELPDPGIDGIGDDDVAWLYGLADRIEATR